MKKVEDKFKILKIHKKKKEKEMLFARPTLPFALLLLLGGVAIKAEELRIHNADELIDFSNNVSSGTSYSGTTVYLDSDIDFTPSLSQQFQPIGKNETNYFQGVFDGQGHTISNLALNSSSDHVGLFGYSKGGTIKNVVLDDSCSFVSSCNSRYSDIGSISGICELCIIDSVVNMASVTFIGRGTANIYLGGILGRFTGSSVTRNCVNYGSVTHSGNVSNAIAYVGGIIGSCVGNSIRYIQNCANYGTITHNGTTATLGIGGILGYVSSNTVIIENCVSGGRILNEIQGTTNRIGNIVGEINKGDKANITHCLWTSDVGYNDIYGYNESSATIIDSSFKELTKETVDKLNEYAKKNSTWDKWFMLHLNGGGINNINQETLIVAQKHFPDPVKEENSFLFWCKDAECSEIFDPNTTDITVVTDLYAGWNKNILTFDFGNGTTINRTYNFDESIAYPENLTREGFIFNGWSPKPERMPAHDLTTIANWTEKLSELVKVTFDRKDMSKKEAEGIIREYTKDDFTIEKIETDKETGGIKIIVKFTDKKNAENFVDNIRGTSDKKNKIISVGFVFGATDSFSSFFYPTLFYALI